MPARDRVDSIIDQAAIEKELNFLNGSLDKLAGNIGKLASVKITLEGADGVKKLVEGNNALSTSLTSVKKSQDIVSLSVQEYNKILSQVAQGQAKLAASQSDAAKSLIETREQQRLQNQEIKNTITARNAEEGSIIQLRSQLSILTKQYDSLSEAQRNSAGGDELKQKIAGITSVLNGLEQGTLRFGRNVGNYSGALKTLEKALGEAKTKLDQYTKAGQQNSLQGQQLQKEVSALKGIVSQNVEGFTSFTQEIRTNERALQTLRAAGLGNAETFKELSLEVAHSRREFRELQNQQKLLSSEAPALAGLTIAARGLAGAYAVGAGVASLFANGNEKVEKELNKLVAIMTVLQGLTEINRLLQERTAISTTFLGVKTFFLNAALTLKNFILTGSTKAITANTIATETAAVAEGELAVATTAASTSMVVLRTALIATGIGALLVLLPSIVSAMSSLGDKTKDAAESFDQLNTEIERNHELSNKLAEDIEFNSKININALKAAGATEADIQKATIKGLRDQQQEKLKLYNEGNDKILQITKQNNKEIQRLSKEAVENEGLVDKSVIEEAVTRKQKFFDGQEAILRKKNSAFLNDANKLAKDIALSNSEFEASQNKKKNKTSEKSLQELKDRLSTEFDIYKNHQERLIKILEEESKNEFSTLDSRLKAVDNFVSASKELNDKQETFEIASAKRKAQRDIQHLNEEKAGKNAAQVARINENIKITQSNLEQEILKIIDTAKGKEADIEQEGGNRRIEIAGKVYDKLQKQAEEHYKFLAEQAKIAQQNLKDAVNIHKDDQLIQLEKDFANGRIKTLEEYQRRKEQIINAADIKEKQLDLDRLRVAEIVFEAQYGFKNLALIRAAKDLEVEINEKADKDIIKSNEERVAKIKELAQQIERTAAAFIEGGFDRQKNAVQDQIDLIEERSKREIDAVTRSGLAEQDKANRINIINIQSAKQKEQLERKQRQIDQERARFERALSVITVIQETAKAVAHDLKENRFLIPFDIAIGAAQIAAILARPIPKFFKGTDDAPKGPGIYGEKGSELVVEKTGRMYLSPGKPTLTSFIGGEKIIPHDITKDILIANNLLHLMHSAQHSNKETVFENPFAEKSYEVLKRIEGKPPVIVNVTPAYETTAHYYQHIKH